MIDAHMLLLGDVQTEQQTTTKKRDNGQIATFGAPFIGNRLLVTIGIRCNVSDHGGCVTSAVAL
jgi:hypothetical protein